MTTRPTPVRLAARLAVTAVLALGLAGGVASAASAAPQGGVTIIDPDPTGPDGPSSTVPDGPERPDPKKSCDDDPEQCKPDFCDPKNKVLPKECRPDPCKPKVGVKLPDKCRPKPCDSGPDHPERCPAPCGSKDGHEVELQRRHQDERCPEPKGCEDRCDRPVPGKPTFTG